MPEHSPKHSRSIPSTAAHSPETNAMTQPSIVAWAATSRAIGTRKGEQET